MEERPIIFLEGFDPTIFAFFALYLNHMPLCPFADLSFTFKGYDAAMLSNNIVRGRRNLTIAMSLLANASNDDQAYNAPLARRLLYAYFLGRKLGAPHFQDAIMNVIARHFRADGPPPPDFITWIYDKCPQGRPIGLRRFFVDFYNWALRVNTNRVPQLSDYIMAFHQDVTAAAAATQKQVLIDEKDPLKRTEPQDIIIDFKQLQTVLCNARQGRLKCRYHHHKPGELCFHYIVDDGIPTS